MRLTSLACCLLVATSLHAETPSFVNDVEPILTRFGCNQGACHGKAAGQNGFRLSLRAYAPDWDYIGLTRELDGRRIQIGVHEGGKLLAVDSPEYRTLLTWIQNGAPGIRKDEPTVRRVELVPGNLLMKPNQEQPLTMRAEFTDGVTKDVTRVTQFVANDPSVATVTPAGLVTMLRPGETAIRATYQGQIAVITVTCPHPETVPAEKYAKRNNFVDEHVYKKLADLHIEPSDLCTDDVFLRRVYLDTIGVLPTPAEVRAFLADKSPDRRNRVIDRLFERPEYVDYWALELGDLLQNRKESDHDVRGAKGVRKFHTWIRDQVASNRRWDEMARELMTATGNCDANPAVGYWILTVGEERESAKSVVVAGAAQTFLGSRIGCAKCHNHPSEKFTQDDYYHFAAFFSRIKFDRKDPKVGTTTLSVSMQDARDNKRPIGVNQPRTNQFLAPQPLDRTKIDLKPGDDPRVKLAEWIVNPANEYFAGAMVNRLWAHFTGVGLVEPIDDLRASNPPTNPALFKALVEEFVKSKFDRRHLIRVILQSRTYQLSSIPTKSNLTDTRFHSHAYARRLPAEVLLDALSQSTGVPEKFDGYPLGLRAVQVPDTTVKSYFLGLFGKSERLTACACERNNDVTLPQLLHMGGGATIPEKLRSGNGRLVEMLKSKSTDRELTDEIFLWTLSRLPTPAERASFEAESPTGADSVSREEAFRDLFWALLNTKEFAFQH
jgi:Protein of unknown function (DUF1549)/Protein of unknown function (DUF1553)